MNTGANKPQGKNVQEMKKRNIEIINNLKQTLSKPTIVEAQRTLKIMERLIDRISIFSNLDTEFIIKFNEINNQQKFRLNKALVNQLSPQVLDAIVKQAKMESEFRVFASLEQQIKENQAIEEEKLKEYERVKKDMAYTFKTLIRTLEKHPEDLEIIKSLRVNSAPNGQIVNIHEALSNYKIIMQKTLATAAEEDESHARLILQLQTKIQSLEKTRSNCDRDLKKLQEDRKQHAEDKKQEMDKLRSQIREVGSNKDRQMDQIAKSSKDQREALTKQYEKQQNNLKTLITQQRTKQMKMRQENAKTQGKSKGDKQTNQNHYIDIIAGYDAEMVKNHTNNNNLSKQLKKLTDELNNLKRHFLQIEEQRKREQALIEADRRRKHLWELMEKKKGEAATKIKQAYRNWKAKNKKKKKKKK